MAKYALLFGIPEFGGGLTPLPAASRDVQHLQALLSRETGGEFYVSAQGPTVTHQDIIHNLRQWCASRRVEDEIVLYVSGHLLYANGQLYLAAANTSLIDATDPIPYEMIYRQQLSEQVGATVLDSRWPEPMMFLAAHHLAGDRSRFSWPAAALQPDRRVWDSIHLTAVPFYILRDALDGCRAEVQTVVLDCCLTHLADPGPAPIAQSDPCLALASDRRIVLASTHHSDRYLPYQKSGNLSVLTHYWDEALHTGIAAPPNQTRMSLANVIDYVKHKLKRHLPWVQIQHNADGHRISSVPLFFGRSPAAELAYRRMVEQVLSRNYPITAAEQGAFHEARHQLGLFTSVAEAIEAEVQYPIHQWQDNLNRYQQAVAFAVTKHYPLAITQQNALRFLQCSLGLGEETAAQAQQQQFQQAERAIAQQQQEDHYRRRLHDLLRYGEAVKRSLQDGYPLSSNYRQRLDHIKASLPDLSQIDADLLETELTTPVEAETHSYQQRLQQYQDLFSEAVDNQLHTDAEVRAIFNRLRQCFQLDALEVGELEQHIIQSKQAASQTTEPIRPQDAPDPASPPSEAIALDSSGIPSDAPIEPADAPAPTAPTDPSDSVVIADEEINANLDALSALGIQGSPQAPNLPIEEVPEASPPSPMEDEPLEGTKLQDAPTHLQNGSQNGSQNGVNSAQNGHHPQTPTPTDRDRSATEQLLTPDHPKWQWYQQYEAAFKAATQESLPITLEAREHLTSRCQELGISEEERDRIESIVIDQVKAEEADYQRRCRQYQEALHKVLQAEWPPSLFAQQYLNQQQHELGIRDKDIDMLTEQAVIEHQSRAGEPTPSPAPTPVPAPAPSPAPSTPEDPLSMLLPVSSTGSPVQTSKRLKEFQGELQELDRLLQHQQWKGADAKTLEIMLKLTGRESHRWLDASAIKSLERDDLLELDRLWATHSRNKFGFGAQLQVYQSLLSPSQKPQQRAIAFARKVGWWSRSFQVFKVYDWLMFQENIVENASVPVGQLPALWFWRTNILESILSGGFGTGRGWSDTDQGILEELMSRVGLHQTPIQPPLED